MFEPLGDLGKSILIVATGSTKWLSWWRGCPSVSSKGSALRHQLIWQINVRVWIWLQSLIIGEGKVLTFSPEWIICLREETVETLYLLGQQDRIVGITAWAVRPKVFRTKKERIVAFATAIIEQILSLKPSQVFAFPDVQANIDADLIKYGVAVTTDNQVYCGYSCLDLPSRRYSWHRR